MVQHRLGFMRSVSLKSHGLVLLSMKLISFPVNQSCFPSALDKFNRTTFALSLPSTSKNQYLSDKHVSRTPEC